MALRTHHRLATLLLLAYAMTLGLAAPAAAQYGGTPTLFVDPVRVPIEGTFDAFGFNCPGASVVTITIDGFPGILATTIANDDSSYAAPAIPMPPGVIAGQDYVVRATCAGGSATFTITAVCNDGSDPVDGECPDDRTVGGQPDGPTTSSPPGAGPDDPAAGPGDTTGPDGQGTGGSNLAFTGAGPVATFVRVGVTLLAVGGVLILIAQRRRPDTAA